SPARKPVSKPASEGQATAASPQPAELFRLTARPRPPEPKAQPIAVGATVRTGAGERRRVVLPDGSVLYVNQNSSAKLETERRVALPAGELFVEVAPRPAGSPFVIQTPTRDVTALGTKFDVRAEKAGTGVLVTQGKVKLNDMSDPVLAGQQLAPGGDEVA